MATNKNTPKVVDSSLDVREEPKSAERTRADLNLPDPKPERANAILDDPFKKEQTNG